MNLFLANLTDPGFLPLSILEQHKGRNRRADIDIFRTIAWCAGVRIKSGWSLNKLNLEFKREGRTSKNTDWNRYRIGSRIPLDREGESDIIQQVDDRFETKDTAKIFRHCLWRILSLDRPKEEDVYRHFLLLDPAVQALLTQHNKRKPYSWVSYNPRIMMQVVALGSLDALAAALLLMDLSRAIWSADLESLARSTFYRLTFAIQNLLEINGQSVCAGLLTSVPISVSLKVHHDPNFNKKQHIVPLHDALCDYIDHKFSERQMMNSTLVLPVAWSWKYAKVLFTPSGRARKIRSKKQLEGLIANAFELEEFGHK